MRCSAIHGYNLHADVHIPAHDRSGLERLCRYLLRPPLARSRITEGEGDDIVVGLKRPWNDGTTEIHLTRLEFLERLCALIPPPHANTVLYHGVLAGHAAMRSEIVPAPRRVSSSKGDIKPLRLIRVENAAGDCSRHWRWAELLARVFSVDGLLCPGCGGRLELRAIVIGPPATKRILDGLARAVQKATA
jgi:hypothetical protein